MSRDPDAIERDIEQARDALAATLDELGTRASPQRVLDSGKQSLQVTLTRPPVRYTLIAVAGVLVLVVVRRLLR